MIPVEVECYAGYKGSERPVLHLDPMSLKWKQYDHWHSPDITYFRVRANDGNTYILKHHEGQDLWSLEVYKAQG